MNFSKGRQNKFHVNSTTLAFIKPGSPELTPQCFAHAENITFLSYLLQRTHRWNFTIYLLYIAFATLYALLQQYCMIQRCAVLSPMRTYVLQRYNETLF